MSKGGKPEKATGADLGFILIVDLPDFPLVIKSIIFQVKKIRQSGNSAQIDIKQFNTLKENDPSSAYLFYDMHLKRLCSPIVNTINKREEERNQKEPQGTFSHSYDGIGIVSLGKPIRSFISGSIDELETDNAIKISVDTGHN
jgi:hypothetical protein